MSFGTVHVLYPIASSELCTAVLIVEVDHVGLVRDRKGPRGNHFSLAQYVNDRPYASSSFMSVAIQQALRNRAVRSQQGTARVGRDTHSRHRSSPGRALPRWRGDLAPAVRAARLSDRHNHHPAGPDISAWSASRYFGVTLTATVRVRDLLEHLFVLLPVLDDDKHYWVGADEVDKLLRRGSDWLGTHPDRELITRRYLRHDPRL